MDRGWRRIERIFLKDGPRKTGVYYLDFELLDQGGLAETSINAANIRSKPVLIYHIGQAMRISMYILPGPMNCPVNRKVTKD